jgi:hypothetical protein
VTIAISMPTSVAEFTGEYKGHGSLMALQSVAA